MKTKYLQSLAVVSTLAVLFPLGALARDKNAHSVTIPDATQVGNTQLAPGEYEVQWQGAGPVVQVSFEQNGKTVATAPSTLKSNDELVTQDDIVTDSNSANTTVLKEIDFGRQKEALVFDQGTN